MIVTEWHGLEIGDWATWFGAVGSAGAALAAFYAARTALEVAKLPGQEAEALRVETARAFAQAIADELFEVLSLASELTGHLEESFSRGLPAVRQFIANKEPVRLKSIHTALPFIHGFRRTDVYDLVLIMGENERRSEKLAKFRSWLDSVPDMPMGPPDEVAPLLRVAKEAHFRANRLRNAMYEGYINQGKATPGLPTKQGAITWLRQRLKRHR